MCYPCFGPCYPIRAIRYPIRELDRMYRIRVLSYPTIHVRCTQHDDESSSSTLTGQCVSEGYTCIHVTLLFYFIALFVDPRRIVIRI